MGMKANVALARGGGWVAARAARRDAMPGRRHGSTARAGITAWSGDEVRAGSNEGWGARRRRAQVGDSGGGVRQQNFASKKRPRSLQLLLVKLSHTCLQQSYAILLT